MESKRHRKGWWTLAAATCNVNHFNACGTPMSSSRGRCDTSDGYPLDDHPARFIPSRHRPEANSKKSMPRNAERKLKEECLERMIFFGEASLRNAVREFLAHYHGERNHQGMGNRILVPGDEVGRSLGDVEGRERLGGLLRYYYRKAA